MLNWETEDKNWQKRNLMVQDTGKKMSDTGRGDWW